MALFSSSARADDVPGLYATGVDDSGNVLAPGAVDPHWQVVSAPASSGFVTPNGAIVATPHPVYVGNDAVGGPGSSWIGIRSKLALASAAGTYVYRTTFDLSGFDPATAALTGRLAVDNSIVDVVLNGTSLGAAGGQFRDWTPFQVDSGFADGVNVLDLVVSNFGADPSGLRVEMAAVADLLPTSIAVVVDVRPLTADNDINPKSMGKLPVAVLSTADFDATSVVPESIVLAGAPVAACRDGSPMAVARDVDGDGRDDLLLFFWTRDLELTADTTSVDLVGLTDEGIEVVGSDSVRIVECVRVSAFARAMLGKWAAREWAWDDESDDVQLGRGRGWAWGRGGSDRGATTSSSRGRAR